jgi:hypothetical protein
MSGVPQVGDSRRRRLMQQTEAFFDFPAGRVTIGLDKLNDLTRSSRLGLRVLTLKCSD